jgi:fatty acid synthase subunit alpha, fungi type
VRRSEGYIKLERGFANIPLPGIDVPFHARYLWAGIMPFPACKVLLYFFPVNAAQLNPDMLVGRYIPTWLPSRSRSPEYAQLIYDQTSSLRLDKVLKKREQESWASSGQRQKKARIRLSRHLSKYTKPAMIPNSLPSTYFHARQTVA